MRGLIIIVGMALGLLGLFMSACGGLFLLADAHSYWTIAAPVTALGVACLTAGGWIVKRQWKRRASRQPSPRSPAGNR